MYLGLHPQLNVYLSVLSVLLDEASYNFPKKLLDFYGEYMYTKTVLYSSEKSLPVLKGRASNYNPPNRFEEIRLEHDPDLTDEVPEEKMPTKYFLDNTKDILAKNDSPDISFNYSLNPYRGCEHGCIYCYARPTHEYLGFSAGLDFETRIFVKKSAPELLEKKFHSRSWQPQVVALSGNTDCYQPVERELEITRDCLNVFLKFRNPVGIVTKNALVLRDLDILKKLAEFNLIHVCISVTTLDHQLARKMEPRTSSPKMRLEALQTLTEAGIPVSVLIAPVIPGLNDHEIAPILKAASERQVRNAGYILLRLPHSVKELMQNWLRQNFPNKTNKVINFVKETRAGKLNDPCFSSRFRGKGNRAETIQKMYELGCKKYGLNKEKIELATKHFRRVRNGQGELF